MLRDGLGGSELGVAMSGLAGPWLCGLSGHRQIRPWGRGEGIQAGPRVPASYRASLWFPGHCTRHHETRVKARQQVVVE